MRIVTGISGSLFVLAFALAGCGSDDSDKDAKGSDAPSSQKTDEGKDGDDSSSEALDVCKLLTTADLQKAFGSPFDEGSLTHQEQTGGDQCVWTNSDAPPVKTFSITVMRQDALGGAIKASGITVKELHEQTKDAFGDTEKIDLGDDAFLAKTELVVLEGETQYTFSTFMGTSDVAINGMKSLAAQVVG